MANAQTYYMEVTLALFESTEIMHGNRA